MIESNMNMHEVLIKNPGIERIFFEFGMHCLGCPISKGETVEQAAASHGINLDELMKALNEFKGD